jgi:hypothetical protein
LHAAGAEGGRCFAVGLRSCAGSADAAVKPNGGGSRGLIFTFFTAGGATRPRSEVGGGSTRAERRRLPR